MEYIVELKFWGLWPRDFSDKELKIIEKVKAHLKTIGDITDDNLGEDVDCYGLDIETSLDKDSLTDEVINGLGKHQYNEIERWNVIERL